MNLISRRLVLVTICAFCGASRATDARDRADEDKPPGSIVLPEGYKFQRLQGIDTLIGKFWREGGMVIGYDIGELAGDYSANVPKDQQVWIRHQTVRNLVMTVVKGKDGQVTATFSSKEDVGKKRPRNPANFYAHPASDEDLADFLMIVMTYQPSPEE